MCIRVWTPLFWPKMCQLQRWLTGWRCGLSCAPDLPVIVAIWSSPLEFPSTETSLGHRTTAAYLTDLHSVGLRQDHFWGVDNACEFVGLGPYTIQPLVQKILSILHSHDVHRTLCQPSDTLHPFQVWLVHVLHGGRKHTVRRLRLASRIRYLNTAQNPSVSQPKGIQIKRESLRVLSLAPVSRRSLWSLLNHWD